MVDLLFTCPLKWPLGRRVTPSNEKGHNAGVPPNLRIEEAIEYVQAELRDFPATDVILSSDYENIRDERLRRKIGPTNNVSLLFEYDGQRFNIACDKYNTLQLNIYAIHLMLRHTLQMIKWGLGDIPVLLAGYRINTDTTSSSLSGNEWWLQYLGLGHTARIADANAVYRSRAKEAADNEDTLLKLNEAIALARNNLT